MTDIGGQFGNGGIDDHVEDFIEIHDCLKELIAARDALVVDLQQAQLDIEVAQQQAIAFVSTDLLRLAFKQWADRNIVSSDPDQRLKARTIRSVIDVKNTAPMFIDAGDAKS